MALVIVSVTLYESCNRHTFDHVKVSRSRYTKGFKPDVE